MTERGLLPQFVREALEQGGDQDDVTEAAAAARPAALAEPAVLGTLLSLENALLSSQHALRSPEHALLSSQHALLSSQHALLSSANARGASAGAAPAGAPGPGLLARLEATLSEPPHRYAPFYASAAELFDLPESDVIAQLARLRDPAVWSFAGLPGVAKVKVTGGPRVAQAETLFVRFSAGVRFPTHEHVGLERVLVLEGSYEDSNGVLHRAGELREWPSNTAHSFRVGAETCIFASVVFARRFSSWPLRALARVLGS